ncbi:SOS response-associated peptidase [Intrasporangium calvum]|uniref:Abasic site processing protein n=1 Tax=Intrasporangium calvum TaxID=53358 RepID=A0ABT5GLN1_9MICO|nr:SOS response-associated peptidase [Intrasporangium calvum]MDC5698790.1 SOS response-associated peptidase [Intrasporangium calvum]
MCGRYAASARPDELVEAFDIDEDHSDEPGRSILKNPQRPAPAEPDWNMAPSKQALVVLTRPHKATEEAAPAEATRQLRLLTWGLVPSWAKDVKVGQRMTNARAESVLGKGAFAKAALSRRCIVPADGWYEWQPSPTAVDAKGKPRKQPFFIHRADGDKVGFAGLYEFWRDRDLPDGHPDAWLTTFTIITTAADPGMDRIHDREPLVLEREQWAPWLDPGLQDQDAVRELLEFSAPGRFEAYPVGRAVGATANNGPALLDPVPREELVGVVDPMTGEVIGG